jgi:REP element-mobilizing transposase RayT
MELNNYSRIVKECWMGLTNHYRCCRLHESLVMPNHVHGIVEIIQSINVGDGSYVGEGLQPSRSYSLTEIIRAFKTFSSRTINKKYPDGLFQWQRSFHDRIIRDKGELAAITRYIVENPRHWLDDAENFHIGNSTYNGFM